MVLFLTLIDMIRGVMILAQETFNDTWPFKPNFFSGNGFKMHYVDEGKGTPIICLHGEPTWGYIYRKFIPPLSRDNRVIVPDHMGFGKSETPQDREYTLKTHVDNLAGLIEKLELTEITFVMQDWGGPIGVAYALRNSEQVSRFIFLNTVTGYGGIRQTVISPWFQFVGELYNAGTIEEVLGNIGTSLVSIMQRLGLKTNEALDPNWVRAYASAFPDKSSAIGAIEFPLDALLRRIVPYVKEGFPLLDEIKSKPAMLAVGMEDNAIDPQYQIDDFKSLYPNAPVVEIPGAGHFCQEDAPHVLIPLIQQFLQMTR